MIELKPVQKTDMAQIVQWRNEQLSNLRTSKMLQLENQEEFYDKIICDRNSNARFFAVRNIVKMNDTDKTETSELIGMIGIENIEWENRRGEISIVLNPRLDSFNDIFQTSVEDILDYAFDELNLENIWGELYKCNQQYYVWIGLLNKMRAYTTEIKYLKYHRGGYYHGLWYNINKFERAKKEIN